MTASKFEFVGSEEEFLKYIAPEMLPRELGGTDDFDSRSYYARDPIGETAIDGNVPTPTAAAGGEEGGNGGGGGDGGGDDGSHDRESDGVTLFKGQLKF